MASTSSHGLQPILPVVGPDVLLLDALGVAEVLDPSLMKGLQHLGCSGVPAGRDVVLEEEVSCPVGGSLVHNHLEVVGLFIHGEFHVVQLDHFQLDDLVEARLLAEVAVVEETTTNSHASLSFRSSGESTVPFATKLHDLGRPLGLVGF